MMRRNAAALALLLALAACQSTASEVGGLAAAAPLDYAVLVTGGAFLAADEPAFGTFHVPGAAPGSPEAVGGEAIAIEDVVGTLGSARVFRRIAIDPDAIRRHRIAAELARGGASATLTELLQRARDDGYDSVLVLEELQDGPIEEQGINGRWPVTFATWILLGVGMLIPDHTFESRATLRVTLRELQTGEALYDPVLEGGPVDLALTERTDVLGIITSIVVPPFWVGNDRENVQESVQQVTRRRLLLQLARSLKSESVRRRLRDHSAAGLSLVDGDAGPELVVDADESLSAVRLRAEPPLDGAVAERFANELLASLESEGGRFRYRARLPAAAAGHLIQVLVATIRGSVASATFEPGGGE
ncbi:MAG: hypothetical protein KDE27_27565 [Planctomycetes bacterium]|nr:hypothetical protein [Planctomycetota bacterium]